MSYHITGVVLIITKYLKEKSNFPKILLRNFKITMYSNTVLLHLRRKTYITAYTLYSRLPHLNLHLRWRTQQKCYVCHRTEANVSKFRRVCFGVQLNMIWLRLPQVVVDAITIQTFKILTR